MGLAHRFRAVSAVALPTLILSFGAHAAPPADVASGQELLTLPVEVVDSEGQPVAEAKVIPWALRCSQGHGLWRPDGLGDSEPPALTTDSQGRVNVPYPRYAVLGERVRTTQVTLSIDHPDFAYEMYESVDVPRKDSDAHIIELQRGATVEITPTINGDPVSPDGLHAVWSDGRSYLPGAAIATDDGTLRIPPMPAGKKQIMLVRVEGGRATHFSKIVDLDLKDGETVREQVELRPAVRIVGKLSDNVPRPVRNGRLSFRTVSHKATGIDQCEWFDWTPIAEDGTFTIESWPADEALQLVALCDGFMAQPGQPPRDAGEDRYTIATSRPQIITPDDFGKAVTIPMVPLVRCEIEVVDDTGSSLPAVEVSSCPNVYWWYNSSQLYCDPLASGDKFLLSGDFQGCVEESYPNMFSATTNGDGRAVLLLPAGAIDIFAACLDYEQPIQRGMRRQEIELVAGEVATVRLVMQPKGTDYLGEWDKLAGILFGCTGDECRRLLEDEGFRNKMTEVRLRLEGAENPADPALLRNAFSEIADAFDDIGDQEEVQTWRRKASEQAAKLEVR